MPVFDHRGEVMAVLDIDSAVTDTFGDVDKRHLESWAARFAKDGIGDF